MSRLPGIFNDVIGPEMRGPSSSHTAASWRIAHVALQILKEPLRKALIEFEREGAWASNYREQGTVMGVNGGLLGLDIRDDRMKETDRLARERKVEIGYKTGSFKTSHPNTMRLTLQGASGRDLRVVAVSTGGGAFEIQLVDDFAVDIRGDAYELLIKSRGTEPFPEEWKHPAMEGIKLYQSTGREGTLLNLKSPDPFSSAFIDRITEWGFAGVPPGTSMDAIILINPLLPIVSGKEEEIPFNSISSMLNYADRENLDLGGVGIVYEKCCSGLPGRVLMGKMSEMVKTTEKSIRLGLEGTVYSDRILHRQSHLLQKAEKEGKIPQSVVNGIIANVTAIMEAKSAMEVIVANPTAGSCGTVGGAVTAVGRWMGSNRDEVVRAFFASGLIGAWFAMGPGFAAEEHGCQVECGAASGMAAAGIVQLMGGTARQAVDAASIAIQNMIGLICDPVADRVEVPCLGRNISGAMNAFSSATMAVSGFHAVVPLDEVLQTVSAVGKQMPSCLKCTGKGGLSLTPTSLQIKKNLAGEGK